MPARRSYQDACATAHAMDLIGDRWALLVVRELILGPRRFTDLRESLTGISPNVLTQRLEELERAGIARRRRLSPPAAAWVYELTEWGMELEPVFVALGRWGVRSPLRPRRASLSVNSLILSMRTMFDPRLAARFHARLELRFGEDRFHAEIASGKMKLAPGSATEPDSVIEADPNALAAVVYGGRKLSEAIRSGDVKVEGKKSAARQFVSLFPLPEPAPAGSIER